MKGADQCPKCASRRWADVEQDVTTFYARRLRVCANCATSWEPFDQADLMDPDDHLSSFTHPCNNCAFRKGSPEQADSEAWESKMISMSFGNSFYCHKGVPVTPDSENGFDYPDGGKDRRKLRLCRGYLNSIVGPKLNELARAAEGGHDVASSAGRASSNQEPSAGFQPHKGNADGSSSVQLKDEAP